MYVLEKHFNTKLYHLHCIYFPVQNFHKFLTINFSINNLQFLNLHPSIYHTQKFKINIFELFPSIKPTSCSNILFYLFFLAISLTFLRNNSLLFTYIFKLQFQCYFHSLFFLFILFGLVFSFFRNHFF